MNPFQRARSEAHKLRETLVGTRKDDAVSSVELLGGIETLIKLGVEKVSPDSQDLGGGDACLNRTDEFIYIRNDVTLSEHAALVAHELGHFVLDGEQQTKTIANLIAITTHAGTPGVVAVEAYGARERQELQANVFGRELLLPRHVAKALFDMGLGPSQVSKELELQVDLVRLQMLDGVLLPSENTPDPKELHSPSPDQEEAAKANERYVNVVAGPGTGKTTTLIHRVKFLVEELKVDPSQILVLTFTNKAAFELVERLRSTGIAGASDVWAGTFHAFGLEFFRKFHQCFGLPSDVKVADKLNGATLLLKQLATVNLNGFSRLQDPYDWLGLVLKCIHRLKEELVTVEQYRKYIVSFPEDDLALQRRREDVASLYEIYETALKAAGMVDFVDLVAGPAKAIHNDRARYSELADRFRYVLVDEYQDVTQAMVELIKQLAPSAKSLWVVGDVRQAIHHWRGASVRSLLVFEETFRSQLATAKGNVRKYPLLQNRRSSSEILALVTCAGEKHELQSMLPLDVMQATSGPTGELPVLFSGGPPKGFSEALFLEISRLRAAGIAYKEQVVISRSSKGLHASAHALKGMGLPVLHVGSLMDRPEIKKLICLMQLLVERQPKALIGLMSDSGSGMTLDDIQVLLDETQLSLEYQRGRWMQNPPKRLSPAGIAAVEQLKSTIGSLTRWSGAWQFICDLLLERRLSLPSSTDQSIGAWATRIALWQFAQGARVGDGENKKQTLSRYLKRQEHRRRLGEDYQERELPAEAAGLDAIRVLTVHGSKGLEYEAVHLVDIHKSSYGVTKPYWDPSEEILSLVPPKALGSTDEQFIFEQAVERNNLLYVALSRARKHLRLYEECSYQNRDRPEQLLRPEGLFKVTTLAPSIQSGEVKNATQKLLAPTEPISFSEFETFARCPLQHHYRFKLNLKRDQEPDTALNARIAIMQSLEYMAKHNLQSARISVLEDLWIQHRLPTKLEDPHLWAEALKLMSFGAQILETFSGSWVQLVAKIDTLLVQLPWMVVTNAPDGQVGEMVRVAPYGISFSTTLIQPLLISMPTLKNINLICLLTEKMTKAQPSKWVEKTNAYKAAQRFIARDRSPTPGLHCDRCAYRSICPSSPG